MADEKILSGEQEKSVNTGSVISSEESSNEIVIEESRKTGTQSERISESTLSGGLKSIPTNFDDKDGDWQSIKSDNPFEVLYLDFKQYKFVTPNIVESNYKILQKFWKDKYAMMSGGTRQKFERKYGVNVVDNSLAVLKKVFDKINSEEGINNYYNEVNNKRLKIAEDGLRETIEDMMDDGVADKDEMRRRLKRGEKYGLEENETALIIKKTLDKERFLPFGEVAGNNLIEQLLSVDWMTEEMAIKEKKKIKEEEEAKKKEGREIFSNVFAYSLHDIGEILYKSEIQAKKFLKEGLIINAVDYFSSPKAMEIKEFSKKRKDEHIRYLETVYRLNPNLPFRFKNDNISNIKGLPSVLFENPKEGLEQFHKGYIEIWLQETNKEAHKKFIEIRDSAENLNLAFLEFIYTFDKSLPYRFSNNILVNSPSELCGHINKSGALWEAGFRELYDNSILTWLKTIGHKKIIEGWNKLSSKNKHKKVAFEEFLHLLDKKIDFPKIKSSISEIDLPRIQSGNIETVEFDITNETRGFAKVNLSLTQNLPGLTIEPNSLVLNNAAKNAKSTVKLGIDSNKLAKGVNHKSNIKISSSSNQIIEIPVSFRIVFPKNAFIKEILIYSLLMAVFFAGIRFILGPIAYYFPNRIGWAFFVFIVGMGTGLYFFIRYLVRRK